LRGAATELGIKSLTIEIGNPQSFQNHFISWTYLGVRRVLNHFGMYPPSSEDTPPETAPECQALLCNGGKWIFCSSGGVLEVYPPVNSLIRKGDLIARVKNIFGNIVEEIFCPQDAVAVGRSSNPVAFSGDRVIHLGFPHPPGQPLPAADSEVY